MCDLWIYLAAGPTIRGPPDRTVSQSWELTPAFMPVLVRAQAARNDRAIVVGHASGIEVATYCSASGGAWMTEWTMPHKRKSR